MFVIRLKGSDLYMFVDPIMHTQSWTDLEHATQFSQEQANAMVIQNPSIEAIAAENGANVA